MTTVVADTSPVNYLVQIGEAAVLADLFGEIIVPPAVHRELCHLNAPAPVRVWMRQPPLWVKTIAPRLIDSTIGLDEGENEAISLAAELNADLILMDERLGRLAARGRGLQTAGTLLILGLAHERRLLDFDTATAKLLKTNFRVSPAILNAVKDQFQIG